MNKGRRFLPPASCTGGLRVNGRLMVYSTAELPEDFPLRLCCLKRSPGSAGTSSAMSWGWAASRCAGGERASSPAAD